MPKYEIDRKLLAKNIKNIRLELGLNQEQFGKIFAPNADKSIVSRWERGKSVPNADRLKLIAQKGNMSIMYLTTGNKTLKDLSDSELEEYKEYQKKRWQAIDKQTDEMYDSIVGKTDKDGLNFLEKSLLTNTTRLIQMIKDKPNSDVILALLSGIISASIRAKMHHYNDEYFEQLKIDSAKQITEFVNIIKKSDVNDIKDFK